MAIEAGRITADRCARRIAQAVKPGCGLALLLVLACAPSRGAAPRECQPPDLPAADSALYRLFMQGAESTWRLDSVLYDAVRSQAHPPDLTVVLEEAATEYGARVVARSLLQRIAHDGLPPYSVSARDRGYAAAAYGSLYEMYPDSVPSRALAALLVVPGYPDELKEGLAIATRYVRDDIPELTLALSFTACQASLHLRPFVHQASDLALDAPGDRLQWYHAALRLLESTVQALAVRPNGQATIDELVAAESNHFLADALERWGQSGVPLHAR